MGNKWANLKDYSKEHHLVPLSVHEFHWDLMVALLVYSLVNLLDDLMVNLLGMLMDY